VRPRPSGAPQPGGRCSGGPGRAAWPTGRLPHKWRPFRATCPASPAPARRGVSSAWLSGRGAKEPAKNEPDARPQPTQDPHPSHRVGNGARRSLSVTSMGSMQPHRGECGHIHERLASELERSVTQRVSNVSGSQRQVGAEQRSPLAGPAVIASDHARHGSPGGVPAGLSSWTWLCGVW